MKNKIATLALAAILSGCATAPLIVGPVIQIGACELAKARPMASAPLLAVGLTFQSYSQTVAPSGAELEAALMQSTALAGIDAEEVLAFVRLVMVGYGPLYASIETQQDKDNLRLWFAEVGSAFIDGSHCKPTKLPPGVVARPSDKPSPTWVDLGNQVKASMKK